MANIGDVMRGNVHTSMVNTIKVLALQNSPTFWTLGVGAVVSLTSCTLYMYTGTVEQLRDWGGGHRY